MNVLITLNDEEKRLGEAYAKSLGLSLEDAIKEVFFERVEDDLDCLFAEKAIKEFEANPVTYSFEDIKNSLN